MAVQPRASRAAFFIFDPELAPESPKPSEEEVADAKILYYSPSSASVEEKRSQVGLLEGIIAFAAMFQGEESVRSNGPLRSLRTKQLAFSILEVEPHTWMVLVMRHAQVSPEGSRGSAEPVYDEERPSDSTLQAILKNCHSILRLLHGEIQSFVRSKSLDKLSDLLEDFIPAFLETVDTTDMGIFQELDGFRYGPVERNTCVTIHCFLDKLQEQFPQIRHSALLYNAHLIYSSCSLDDLVVLYGYLVSFNGAVSNLKLNRVPFGRLTTAASQPGGGSSSFGRAFLLSDEDDYLLGSARGSVFVPTVHLLETAGQLVVLTFRGIMLVLIFEKSAPLDLKMLESLRVLCNRPSGDGLSLAELHPMIAPQYAQVMEHEDQCRFVYYNQANHALWLSNQPGQTRSLLGGTRPVNSGPKPQERGLLPPLRSVLADPRLKCREVSWKSADRGWICAKRWREREFYLLLDGVATSLSRCQEECARFASKHFKNIFMM